MFEVGRAYTLVTSEMTGEGLNEVRDHNCVVLEVDGPRVKFRQFDRTFIINTLAPQFFKGIDQPEGVDSDTDLRLMMRRE